MTLDERILQDVEAARTTLEDLEDQAYEARATLHQSIRRLHAAGGSMREIATALGMSHQRVHQIIGADGIVEVEATSTEVAPLPGAAPAPAVPAVPASSSEVAVSLARDAEACSFCGAGREAVDKLLAAPGPVFVCSGCVAAAAAGELRTVGLESSVTCSFCGNDSTVVGDMAEADSGAPRICRRCVATCERLVRTDEPAKTMVRRNSRLRCSFCNGSARDVPKLLGGPTAYICGDCVDAAARVVAGEDAARGPRQVVLRSAMADGHGCSFCGRGPAHVSGMAKGGRGRICDDCVSASVAILTADAAV